MWELPEEMPKVRVLLVILARLAPKVFRVLSETPARLGSKAQLAQLAKLGKLAARAPKGRLVLKGRLVPKATLEHKVVEAAKATLANEETLANKAPQASKVIWVPKATLVHKAPKAPRAKLAQPAKPEIMVPQGPTVQLEQLVQWEQRVLPGLWELPEEMPKARALLAIPARKATKGLRALSGTLVRLALKGQSVQLVKPV